LSGVFVRRALVVIGLLAGLLVPVVGTPPAQAASDPYAPRTAACSVTVTADCTRRIDYPVGTLTRTVYVYLPPAADQGTVPLVVVVHGLRMSPRTVDGVAGWTDLARKQGFAVALPQGYGAVTDYGYQASWNARWCCGPAAEPRDDVDDFSMMDATVTVAEAAIPHNGKTYYVGFSNGAMLAFRLYCADRGLFDGFVAVHGTMTFPSCWPAQQRPFLAITAYQDMTVPYRGCTMNDRRSSCARIVLSNLTAVGPTMYALRRAAGCTGLRSYRYAPHVIYSWSTGCTRRGPQHLVIGNAGHPWVTDKAMYGVNETQQAWGFIRQWSMGR
jgi:poly(3-hydroxybutyrate) depolymerase